MRICLVAMNAFDHDPRATSLCASLRRAGHDVTAVAVGTNRVATPPPVEATSRIRTVRIPPRAPSGRSRAARFLRARQPESVRTFLLEARLARAARFTGAELFYPTGKRAVRAATWAAWPNAAYVLPHRRWGPRVARRDLAWIAPERPELSAPSGGSTALPRLHVSAAGDDVRGTPAAGRHEGIAVVLCYQKTERNPGRYLESALRRAGIDLRVVTDALDWTDVPASTRAVVFVESPLPAIEVAGTNPGVPVAFWVHHGEHHLAMNLRLARRYGADVILLAHSWHLAHRFDAAVERFPFAVATEVFRSQTPLAERPYDVAFVGRHIEGGGPYDYRQRLLESVAEVVPTERLALVDGVSPEEVAALYNEARIVPNEGGSRHLPITMRVFEAIGCGALLATQPAPGLDRLLVPNQHYLELEDEPGEVVRRLLGDDEHLRAVARAAQDHALRHHTYDHRVDELLATVDRVGHQFRPRPSPPTDPLAATVDSDVEVHRMVTDSPTLRHNLPEREVWDVDTVRDRLEPAAYDAVVLTGEGQPSLDRVVRAARRYIYAQGPDADRVIDLLPDLLPDATWDTASGVLRVDLRAEGYRI